MESVVNLLVPADQRISALTLTEIIEEGDIGNLTYDVYGHKFDTFQEAAVTIGAFKGLFANVPESENNLQVIEEKINRILNPPEDYFLVNPYDLDITKEMELVHIPNHEGYYVTENHYQDSCPHHKKHYERYVGEGVISCFQNLIYPYSALTGWRFRHQPPSYIPLDGEGMMIDPDIETKLNFYKLLCEAVLDDTDITGKELYVYELGKGEKLDINTMTRGRLYYNYNKTKWETFDDYASGDFPTNKMIILDGYSTVLDGLVGILNDIFNKLSPVSMTSIVKAVTMYVDFPLDKLRDIVTRYFEGLHLYTNSVFSLTDYWLHTNPNVPYTLPQIQNSVITENGKALTSVAFSDIVAKINALNLISYTK